MPNYNGVWSLSTQYQYAATWSADNLSPAAALAAGRALFGAENQNIYKIDFVTPTVARTDFGDLSVSGRSYGAAVGSSTRAVFSGGSESDNPGNVMDFVTFATEGNATDFGDLTDGKKDHGSASNNTRGLFIAGTTGSRINNVDYITIASAGNATDFGDASQAKTDLHGCASPTRAVNSGGNTGSRINNIDYYTIGSTGNATDFGDLTVARSGTGMVSSSTRGVTMGGYSSSGQSNVIDYITIASAGNASDFGDMTEVIQVRTQVASNSITGIGLVSSNKFDKITIASTGDATDFGGAVATNIGADGIGGACNAHGGIA